MIEALEATLETLWQDLERGAKDPRSPYWRPIVATTHPVRGPIASTVVVRTVDRGASTIEWHSDQRTAKVAALTVDPRAALTWYESRTRVQVRGEGVCVVHLRDDVARRAFQKLGPASRRLYAQEAHPGSALDRPEDVEVPEDARDFERLAFPRFALVRCRLHRLDRLTLSRDGQERAVFERSPAGWIGAWAAP